MLNRSDSTEKVTPGEAAHILGVSTRTVLRMGDRGELDFQSLPSGHRRYFRTQIVAMAGSERARRSDDAEAVTR